MATQDPTLRLSDLAAAVMLGRAAPESREHAAGLLSAWCTLTGLNDPGAALAYAGQVCDRRLPTVAHVAPL